MLSLQVALPRRWLRRDGSSRDNILPFQLADKFLHGAFAVLGRTGEINFGPSADVFGEDRIQQRIQIGLRKRARVVGIVALMRQMGSPFDEGTLYDCTPALFGCQIECC
jgi:hypothetical protein